MFKTLLSVTNLSLFQGAKVRRLPPILGISLLRFNFDPVKFERYKETGKFTFPLELDMAEFCENVSV